MKTYTVQSCIVELIARHWPQNLIDLQMGLKRHGFNIRDTTLRQYLSRMAKEGSIARSMHGSYIPVGIKPKPVQQWLAEYLLGVEGWLADRDEILATRRKEVGNSASYGESLEALRSFVALGLLDEQDGYFYIHKDLIREWMATEETALDDLLA